MGDWRFRLGDLAATAADGRPTQKVHSAMAVLLVGRFLRLTVNERAKQVPLGPPCRPTCGLCEDIALRHAQWATDKLTGHLVRGAPRTHGAPVRDWMTILHWVTSAEHRDTEVIAVQEALNRWLPASDRLLPLVLALSTQLLPSSRGARAPRRLRDYVGDPRRSVLAQRQGWAVKPNRDLRELRFFSDLRRQHGRGVDLLVEVVKILDYGDADPYRSVLGRPETRPGDQAALRALIEDMLADQPTRDWFMLNVDARHSYNEDLRRRADRYTAEVDVMAEVSELPDGVLVHLTAGSVEATGPVAGFD